MIFPTALRKLETLASVPIGFISRRSIEKERLSGDAFAAMADVALFKTGWKEPSLSELRGARVVFVAGHKVEEFVSDYSSICSPDVLLVGDGDRDWEKFEFPELSRVSGVYLQNSSIKNDRRFRCLPIGLESRRLGRNGMPYNFLDIYATRPKKRGIFFGPLGNTHPVRDVVTNLEISEVPNHERIRERISSIEFAYRSSRWSHVIAPRGNGHDTHRFWETLYRGSIPVVTDDAWAKNISQYGIPMETVASWTVDEIKRISLYPVKQTIDPRRIPALWQDYWIREIKEFL